MYTEKKRAELADICYMTIEKECSKPIEEINTALVDACIDLTNKLLDIQPLCEEELLRAKKKIEAMAFRRRRKKLQIRIIAAILVILTVLITTACALSDWLIGIFGIEKLYCIPPGYNVTVEDHELEAPSNILYFDRIEDLVEYVDQSLYLPIEPFVDYKLNEIQLCNYEDKRITISWSNDEANIIECVIILMPSYFNDEKFNIYEHKYYSKDGYPFVFLQTDNCWQAMGWIDNNEYIILGNNEENLKSVIDKMTYVE